ncbi:10407_t:CDS:2 [Entrophospora sp. SA101]|nr:10407_t:CDS:2 [Entrophospora sp. SA101]
MVLNKVNNENNESESKGIDEPKVIVTIANALKAVAAGVANDRPTVTTSYSSMDEFPLPDLNSVDCGNYVTQPTLQYNNTYWFGLFAPKFSFLNNPQLGRQDVMMIFTIVDPSYNHDTDYNTFTISMSDPEHNAIIDPYANSFDNSSYANFVTAVQKRNQYDLGVGFQYLIKMTRSQRNVLIDAPQNNFGLSSNYPIPYIQTTIRKLYKILLFNEISGADNRNEPNSENYDSIRVSLDKTTTVSISALHYLLETENEQRQFLTVISSIIAVWGGLSVVYIFLFGVNSIKPWGYIQEKCFKRKVLDKLNKSGAMTFATDPDVEKYSDEARINGLEIFLKDYIVDVSLLKQQRIKNKYLEIDDDVKSRGSTVTEESGEGSGIYIKDKPIKRKKI